MRVRSLLPNPRLRISLRSSFPQPLSPTAGSDGTGRGKGAERSGAPQGRFPEKEQSRADFRVENERSGAPEGLRGIPGPESGRSAELRLTGRL